MSKRVIRGDLLEHGSGWDRRRAGGRGHGVDVVGGWCVRGVLGPRDGPHAVPDPHVVKLPVKPVHEHAEKTCSDNEERLQAEQKSMCGLCLLLQPLKM